MERKILLHIIILITMISYSTSSGSWYFNTMKDTKQLDYSLETSFKAYATSDCAIKCAMNEKCYSFAFYEAGGTCQQYKFKGEGPINEDGWIYGFDKEEESSAESSET
ncbi:unnamed protein product [Owenia fusiformis]|uniref:Apple domain-containing protein n=1 Tax=Owenia fusiformis TaxID=6347 RepID=A0A8S4NIY2_OWEFU|nr:unnamed protein product [Owenia fusiformis]